MLKYRRILTPFKKHYIEKGQRPFKTHWTFTTEFIIEEIKNLTIKAERSYLCNVLNRSLPELNWNRSYKQNQ